MKWSLILKYIRKELLENSSENYLSINFLNFLTRSTTSDQSNKYRL